MARVLVIDDDVPARAVMRRMLEIAGHDVREAGDGAAALRLLNGQPADVIITDLYMPGMDGIQLARELRKLEASPAIVAVSGGGFGRQVDLLPMAETLGASVTLPKPFTGDALRDAVERALAQREEI